MTKTITNNDIPTRARIWLDEVNIVAGAALVTGTDTLSVYNIGNNQSASAIGDSWSGSCFIRSGAYTLYILGNLQSNAGIMDIYLDGVLVASGIDWYSVATVRNTIKSVSFTVPTDGRHTIHAIMSGKNAGSSAYFWVLVKGWLKQASDLTPGLGLDGITTFVLNDLPNRDDLWMDEVTVLTGNPLTSGVNAAQIFNVQAYQNPFADGSSFTNSCYLRAGTYTLFILGLTQADSGKVDWYIDDMVTPAISAQDWYTAVLTANVVKTASVTINTDGYHVIKGKVNGKNVASTNYSLVLSFSWFAQAAD